MRWTDKLEEMFSKIFPVQSLLQISFRKRCHGCLKVSGRKFSSVAIPMMMYVQHSVTGQRKLDKEFEITYRLDKEKVKNNQGQSGTCNGKDWDTLNETILWLISYDLGYLRIGRLEWAAAPHFTFHINHDFLLLSCSNVRSLDFS